MTSKIFNVQTITARVLDEVAGALKTGAVIIIPTETVYGFACDAYNEDAISKIYTLKNRTLGVPLQLLLPSVDYAKQIADLTKKEEKLALHAWPGEMTLIVKPSAAGEVLARGFNTLGLRVPNHSFVQSVLATFGGPLAATSANIHTSPPISKEKEIEKAFNGHVEYIFLNGDIAGKASTVVQLDPFKIIREGKLTKAQILAIIN